MIADVGFEPARLPERQAAATDLVVQAGASVQPRDLDGDRYAHGLGEDRAAKARRDRLAQHFLAKIGQTFGFNGAYQTEIAHSQWAFGFRQGREEARTEDTIR
jgi:hypothetical protein